MRKLKLPHENKERVMKYCKGMFMRKSIYKDESFQILSDDLKNEVIKHTHSTLIKNVTLLGEFSSDIIENIMKYLKKEIFLPGDWILKYGTTGDAMYFIVQGTVAVYTYYGIEVAHLKDGAHFGEIGCILENHKRTTNVIALEFCEICRLDRKHFLQCIQSNPLIYNNIYEAAILREKHLEMLNDLHMSRIIKKSILKKTSIDHSIKPATSTGQ